jgi:hypothetical protein
LADKKHTDEMIGDALREAGTLILVFAPLYALFEAPTPTNTWPVFCLVLISGFVALLAGIQVERKRP